MRPFLAPIVLLVAALSLPAPARAGQPPADTTIVLVGGSAGDGATPTLARLEERLRGADPARTVVIFTGNYSAAGLPPEAGPGRARAEREILAHVTSTQAFAARGGRVYFLAGDRDFPPGGSRVVGRLRLFLNRSFEAAGAKPGLDVMPTAACATPILLEPTEKLGLLLLNSQWWMQEPLEDPALNEGCELKTHRAFYEELTDAYRSYRDRRLIVASHHPLASYGELGGAFTPAAHLRPAPLLGTAWVFARQSGLVAQHQNHPLVRAWVELLHDQAETNGSYLFASGHDASLQYLAVDRQTQVISGSSGRVGTPTVRAGQGEFAAPSPGWAELVFEPSGAGAARFFSPEGTPLFRRPLPPVAPVAPRPTLAPAPLPAEAPAVGFSTKPVWELPGLVRFFTGAYYSEAYGLKLRYEVLDLEQEAGGLTPFKIGGGLQTSSVRAHDPQGGDWSIRATTKDASRLPPYPYNQLQPVERLLDYAFTSAHPEAALAVPPLATAVGILHSRPRLMYLPDQAALAEYRGFVGDELVLVEQRPHTPDQGQLPPWLGGRPAGEEQPKIRQYYEMTGKLLEDPARHRLDQEAMLRARLLDLVVGDWDRHRGQWRFAATKGADGLTLYQPIALDRDQAFAHFDGVGLMVARAFIPRARSLQGFEGDCGSLTWFNYNARDVDPFVLNRVSYRRWTEVAAEVQAALTDEVIEEAMATWRPETLALDGARITAALKARRDGLAEAAGQYYRLLSQNVDVLGSAGDDLFELRYQPDGAARLTVRGRARGAQPWFERTFHPDETAELRLYALEGEDLLVVGGAVHQRIAVGFVGGEGHDRVTAAATGRPQPLSARAVQLYDSPDGAEIDPSISVRDRRSSLARLNQYIPEENHEPDFGYFLPIVQIRSSEQVYLGGTWTQVFQGFKKEPFAAQHQITGVLTTESLGGALIYRGLFPESLDLLDQQLEVGLRSPSYTRNFYGLTNEFVEDADSPDFFRVRQARYEARYGLAHSFNADRARVGAQLSGEVIETEATEGRIVTASPDVSPASLGTRTFAGARLFAELNTFDNLSLPRRGIALHASVQGRFDPRRGSELSTTWRGAGAAAIPFDRARRLVLLTRASLEGIVGDHPFYLAPTLGGTDLRAYHFQQLAGEGAFVNSNDLRLDLIRIESVLPGTIGISAGIDHGRVFGSSIPGDRWHLSYGGGLWWSVVDAFGVSVSYFRGLDGGSRFILEAGPLFANTGF